MKKLWQNQKLLLKLLLMSLTLVVVSLLVMYGVLINETKKRVLHDQGQQILAIGHEVAVNPQVIQSIESGQTSQGIQDYATKVEERFQLDYLVIILADSIRLTHPNKSLIGSHFQGENDQHRALDLGESYYHTGNGPLGRSLRGFVPVYNDQGEVIGAISLGITLPNLQRFIDRTNRSLARSLIASFIIGSFLSLLLALSLKNQMLGMEPQEIASVLEERNAMFQKTRDPILLINTQGQVTYLNEVARKNWPEIEGQDIQALFDGIDLMNDSDLQLIQDRFSKNSYVASLAKVKPRKLVRGYIVILRDTSELQSLVTQLDHSEYFAKQLAKQNHDFMNKLHVIYGLADFERLDELKNYLTQLSHSEVNFNQNIQLLINNSAIAGHLLIDQAKRQLYDEISIETELPSPANYQETSNWLNEIHYFESWLQELEAKSSLPVIASISMNYQEGELITDIWLDDLEVRLRKQAASDFEERANWQVDLIMEPAVHLRLLIDYGG
ncbi:Spo0B domain-containing protein [Hutsoniella sourekii]